MKWKIEILAAIVLFTVCSGSKCKDKTRFNYMLTQQMKDYTLFKTNSYWVYQLEGSGTTDSVNVFKVDIGLAMPSQLDHNYENFAIQCRSSHLNENVIISGFAASPSFYDSDFLKFGYSGSLGTDIVAYFTKKSKGYKFVLFPAHETEYKDSLASTTIGSKTYNKVMVFEVTATNPPSDQRLPKKIYHAANIGIVRKELYNGQIWNLIRHQVSQ